MPGLWLLGREGPLTADRHIGAARNQERVPYGQLMSSRTFIGCVLIGFLAYWLVTIAVVWLSAYLEKGLGYSASEVGWIVTIAPLCQIVLMPGICSLSELLTRNGASSRRARGLVAALSVLVAGLMTMLLPLSEGPVLPILCTALAFLVGNLIFYLGPVMIAELTSVEQRGAMLGIYNAMFTLAGPLAPVVMGIIIDAETSAAEGFRVAFIATGACATAGALLSLVLINPEADLRRMAQRA